MFKNTLDVFPLFYPLEITLCLTMFVVSLKTDENIILCVILLLHNSKYTTITAIYKNNSFFLVITFHRRKHLVGTE